MDKDAIVEAINAEYEAKLQEAIAAALAGRKTRKQLEDVAYRLSYNYNRLYFLLGGGDLLHPKADAYFAENDKIHRNSARRLAADVFNGRYAGGDDA